MGYGTPLPLPLVHTEADQLLVSTRPGRSLMSTLGLFLLRRSAQGAVSAGDAALGELHVHNVRRTDAGRLQLHPLHRTTVRVRLTYNRSSTGATMGLFSAPGGADGKSNESRPSVVVFSGGGGAQGPKVKC